MSNHPQIVELSSANVDKQKQPPNSGTTVLTEIDNY